MSFDQNDINKIKNMSKEDFSKGLKNAVSASGINENLSAILLRDSDKVKKTLEGLSEKELNELSEIIKKNNLGGIESIIKKEINK